MAGIRSAVGGVKASLEDLRSNTDPAREATLRLNLRESRDVLARRLTESSVGGGGGGYGAAAAGGDASLGAATREARVLLDEVNGQFFS